MKVVLAGAFGNLGAEILKVLCARDYEVVAADLRETEVAGTVEPSKIKRFLFQNYLTESAVIFA